MRARGIDLKPCELFMTYLITNPPGVTFIYIEYSYCRFLTPPAITACGDVNDVDHGDLNGTPST